MALVDHYLHRISLLLITDINHTNGRMFTSTCWKIHVTNITRSWDTWSALSFLNISTSRPSICPSQPTWQLTSLYKQRWHQTAVSS